VLVIKGSYKVYVLILTYLYTDIVRHTKSYYTYFKLFMPLLLLYRFTFFVYNQRFSALSISVLLLFGYVCFHIML